MSERLDRIEALLEQSAQRQSTTDAQIANTRDDIETLLGAASSNESACRELRAAGAQTDARINRLTDRAESNERRFETLLSEARADREETRRLWNDAVTQMEADRSAAKAQADADRSEAGQNFSAQMEVIQRLLVELVDMNRDNRRLRDRLDGLERAS